MTTDEFAAAIRKALGLSPRCSDEDVLAAARDHLAAGEAAVAERHLRAREVAGQAPPFSWLQGGVAR